MNTGCKHVRANILLVRTLLGRGEGYVQNGILKITLKGLLATLGAFLGTSSVFFHSRLVFCFFSVFCDVLLWNALDTSQSHSDNEKT